jgi:hypothetical protein
MNSETKGIESQNIPELGNRSTILLDSSEVQAMRHGLHELANVFTGVMIASALLLQNLGGGRLRDYATDISEGSERGCNLLRELRDQLLTACGEPAGCRASSGTTEASRGERKIS